MPNRLRDETSPYLLQHADNPVDWYPWGEAALQKARREDKPILLSIGYSACHWCHVMAHESFEDESTARLMNELFVNIKVDREERPDLDAIYMQAVQAMTGQGGWPMTVFLKPDLVPFFGGTYFPSTPRHGMLSFHQVLTRVARVYEQSRDEIEQNAQRLLDHMQQSLEVTAGENELQKETLEAAHHALARHFDDEHGGFGGQPKFPPAMPLEFLIRQHQRSGWEKAWEMVDLTLHKMAHGGMYDQLGGGFHRYSVDECWLVPHFEKMLYDNALLSRVYLHAYQASGDVFYRRVAQETLDYIVREMTDPQGGFYSTQDADSEGQEGKFFVWTPEQIDALLGPKDGPLFRAYFDVTETGNFEGQNILHVRADVQEVAAEQDVALERLEATVERGRRVLFEAREGRVKPGRDDKVLTAWNGLMLAAFAEAATALDRDDYRAVAERNADFLLAALRTPEGRLYHVWKDGVAKVDGFLADYTHLIEGLLALYQATFDPRWYQAAKALADTMIAHFSAEVGFYDTADDAESLILRPRGLQDNAVPSGNAMAATVLLKLAQLSGEMRYETLARRALTQVEPLLGRHPQAFGQWLAAFSHLLSPAIELAIIGDPAAADTRALLAVTRAGYHPKRIVAAGLNQQVPLLQSRPQVEGRASAYVCVDATCRPPVTDPEALKALLA
jgi:uncharacterized protein